MTSCDPITMRCTETLYRSRIVVCRLVGVSCKRAALAPIQTLLDTAHCSAPHGWNGVTWQPKNEHDANRNATFIHSIISRARFAYYTGKAQLGLVML